MSFVRYVIGYVLMYDSVLICGIGFTVPLYFRNNELFSILGVHVTKTEMLFGLAPILTLITLPIWIILPILFLSPFASQNILQLYIRTAISCLLGNAFAVGLVIAFSRIHSHLDDMSRWILESTDCGAFFFVVLLLAPIISHTCGFSLAKRNKSTSSGNANPN